MLGANGEVVSCFLVKIPKYRFLPRAYQVAWGTYAKYLVLCFEWFLAFVVQLRVVFCIRDCV